MEHPKTLRLATLLSTPERPCDVAEALGILEALCNHFAPRFCPQGNVGKFSDQEIALGCGSTRDAHTLIAALRTAGWLDAHEEHRLLIHDWHEHADELVRKKLKYSGLRFLTGVRKSRRISENLRHSRPPARVAEAEAEAKGCTSISLSSPDPEGDPKGGGFATFWAAYPIKKDKQRAQEAWAKLKPDAALVARMVTAIQRLQALDSDWRRGYIPHPTTFLHRRRWDDEPKPIATFAATDQTAGNAAVIAAVLARGRA